MTGRKTDREDPRTAVAREYAKEILRADPASLPDVIGNLVTSLGENGGLVAADKAIRVISYVSNGIGGKGCLATGSRKRARVLRQAIKRAAKEAA